MTARRDEQTNAPLQCGYALPGGEVALEVDDPALASWIDEFLLPGVDRVEPATSAPAIVVSSHPEPSVTGPREATALGVAPCFALDRDVAGHPARRIGSSIVVDDERYGTEYRLDHDAIRVFRPDRAARSRAGVMRVVREVTTAQALADGTRLQLHGAALAHDGRVVVLAGPKEAGKTTLTARLASVGGGSIVGNDRLLASPDPQGSWTVRGIATVVSIRPGTRDQLRGQFDDFPDVPSPAHLTLAELDAVSARGSARAPAGRLKLSTAQFARATGAPMCHGGDLACVFLVSFDVSLDGYVLARSIPERVHSDLDAIRYGSRRDGAPRTVFEEWLGVHRPSSADGLLLDGLAASVPVWALRVGPRVLHDDDLAGELLREVLAGG